MATNKTTCSIPECGNDPHARGWCNKHYRRWKKSGDPLGTKRYNDHEESISVHSEQIGNCLVWTGPRSELGYGRIRVNGRLTFVHRYLWEKHNGPIECDLWIDHICRNKSCIELEHLRLVTHKQNMENLHTDSQRARSGIRGVGWDARSKKWRAKVSHNKKTYVAGYFATVEEAAVAVRELRNKLFTHNSDDRR